MPALRYFLDTHDQANNTFPANFSAQEFAGFFTVYEQACAEEGVIPIRLHVGYEAGRAFCLNLAPNAEAVRRVHERVGLPFDSITEVTMATTGDTFFQRAGNLASPASGQ